MLGGRREFEGASGGDSQTLAPVVVGGPSVHSVDEVDVTPSSRQFLVSVRDKGLVRVGVRAGRSIEVEVVALGRREDGGVVERHFRAIGGRALRDGEGDGVAIPGDVPFGGIVERLRTPGLNPRELESLGVHDGVPRLAEEGDGEVGGSQSPVICGIATNKGRGIVIHLLRDFVDANQLRGVRVLLGYVHDMVFDFLGREGVGRYVDLDGVNPGREVEDGGGLVESVEVRGGCVCVGRADQLLDGRYDLRSFLVEDGDIEGLGASARDAEAAQGIGVGIALDNRGVPSVVE